VAVWGKPRELFTHCGIGPRFWYGYGFYGDLSLFFIGDRLVVIEIYGPRTEDLVFDNGLIGKMSRTECEKLLGTPIPHDPDNRRDFFLGEVSYRTGNVRTDLIFSQTSPRRSALASDYWA